MHAQLDEMSAANFFFLFLIIVPITEREHVFCFEQNPLVA
jgi:hypothetical protein